MSFVSITTLRRALVVVGIASTSLVAGMAMSNPRYAADAKRVEAATANTPTWLANLKGKHRQLFDAPASGGGIPLIHMLNFYDTYNKAFGVEDKDINGVLTFYGSTTFHGLSDEMWAKYKLGEFLGEKDAAGNAFTVNPWRTSPLVIGAPLPAASIESMQKRGATFIICNNALTIFSGMVAKQRGLDAAAVYADMKANILPNVTLVPGMVVAIEQAQVAGLTYHRQ